MQWYALVKIVHYLGFIALFGAFVIHPRAGARLRGASTAAEARAWLDFLALTRAMVHSGAAIMLLSGIAMVAMLWRAPVPFIGVGLVTLSVAWMIWTLVPGRHLRAMHQAMQAVGPGPLRWRA